MKQYAMKPFTWGRLLLILICLCPVQLSAQERALSAGEVDSIINPPLLKGNEVLHFDKPTINVGQLSEDDAPVAFRFTFRNVSRANVTLVRVYTSCGCTVATFDKSPVKPGEAREIKLVLNPSGQAGTLNKSAFVYTHLSQSQPTAKITLVGKVTPTANRWVGYPYAMGNVLRLKRTTLQFNDMPLTATRTERLVCVNSGKKALKLSALMPPRYATFRTEPAVIPPGEEADIVITVDGRLLPPLPKSETSFWIMIDGIDAAPSDRSLKVKVSLQK